jgi:NAD(P)-dependent dehydrogenase (short-subunit alcohol dehydrogenase family)
MSRPLEAIPIDLSGKRVVVTGATAGIGHEAALELAKLGADVTVVGRTDAKAAAAIDALVARGAPRDRLAPSTRTWASSTRCARWARGWPRRTRGSTCCSTTPAAIPGRG